MKSPWKRNQPLEADQTYVAVATDLIAETVRSFPRMFVGAQRTGKQMTAAPGCVGFASQAQPLARRYRSISLWESEEALAAFVHSGAHGELVRTMSAEVASFRSVHWVTEGSEGRPTWRDAGRRLAADAVPG